jgi:hypothetical protein
MDSMNGKQSGKGERRKRSGRMAAFLAFCMVIAAIAGCANGNTAAHDTERDGTGGDTGIHSRARDDEGRKFRMRGLGLRPLADDAGSKNHGNEQDGIIRLTRKDGELYVPVRDLAEKLEFKTNVDPETGTFRIGDNDVAFELKAGSAEASRYGDPVRLDKPAVSMNGELYAPLDTVRQLFDGVFEYELDGESLRLKPQEEPADDSGLPEFRDDPYDPYTNPSGAKESSGRPEDDAGKPADIPVDAELKNIDVNALIKTAHQYIGVPYVFGAKPYPQSKVFDCSSFVQYVYGKHGVELPRSSRKQATVGQPVKRTELRKGDLLFFYLPGRYKSNDIVGHVGIYIGNGKMIHSSNKPKDGVQVTDINKAFWKKTYLSARRVVY